MCVDTRTVCLFESLHKSPGQKKQQRGGWAVYSNAYPWLFMPSPQHRTICVPINAEQSRRACSIAFTILGMAHGDCLLICKWRARCQVRNISRWCCWFQTRFYLVWAWNCTTQAVCGTRKLLILQPPGGTWRSPKTIVPQIHAPLWQTYHTLLAIPLLQLSGKGQQRAVNNSVCRRMRSLQQPACQFIWFFIKTMSAGIFFVRYLYWTMQAFAQNTPSVCWLPSEARLAVWISLCFIVAPFSLPCCWMEAVTSWDSHNLDSPSV